MKETFRKEPPKMKREERTLLNQLRKSVTPDTINVEIPVNYSHEGRQAIRPHERRPETMTPKFFNRMSNPASSACSGR